MSTTRENKNENREEQPIRRKKKNRKARRFWLIYLIVFVLLVGVMIILNTQVWSIMEEYQNSQPDQVLTNALKDIADGKVDIQVSSKFEDASASAKEDFINSIKGKDLTYMLDSKSTDKTRPIYDVLLDDKTVAKVTLESSNPRTKLLMLVIQDWKVADVTPIYSENGSQYIYITLPQSYTAKVNGIELGKEEQVGDAKVLDGFSYAAEYVKVPQYVSYEVTGLYNQPEVTVFDSNGNAVSLPEDADLTNLKIDYAYSEVPEEISSMVMTNAKTYSLYFSHDIEGCYESTASIAYMFPEGSNYLVLADQYRREDMSFYSYHQAPYFSDEVVKNYISYSEDLFSVEVSFKKYEVLVHTNGDVDAEPTVTSNDKIYQYVKVNGSWVIADMVDALN